jgi:hypothetical protein
VAFDNYEDYGYSPCLDDHFKFSTSDGVTNAFAHSGHYSRKVSHGTPALISEEIKENCPNTAACNLAIGLNNAGGSYVVNATGGTPPLSYSWEVVNGSPFILLQPNGSGIAVSSTQNWEIKVKVQDSKGCFTTNSFHN